jgi:hypothetical protein
MIQRLRMSSLTFPRSRTLRLGSLLLAAELLVVGAIHGPPAGLFAEPARPPATQPAPPSPYDVVGLTALRGRLGRDTPRGEGVVAGHVEGGLPDYMPNVGDARFRGVRLIPGSGRGAFNAHTDATAGIAYGPNGWAPGIERVTFFTARHWMTDGCLKAGTPLPPSAGDIRLFNHSWIASGNSAEMLRRVDYLIDRDDVIMVVGVNNNAESAVPDLLASSYNAIAVGSGTLNSSGGFTKVEVEGRCKPELIAPMGLTSFATPGVTALAARLLETADRMKAKGETSDAGKPEVIKAVLLAGAEKTGGWKQLPGKTLDEHAGAGMVRIDRSYDILAAGPSAPGMVGGRYGWAFRELSPGGGDDFTFETPRPLGPASLVLVWNRRIEGGQVNDLLTGRAKWNNQVRLADFDLRLFHTDDAGKETELAASTSAIDNVEHVYRTGLPRGRYRIEVGRKDELAEGYDYALAWRIEKTPPATQPAPAAALE